MSLARWLWIGAALALSSAPVYGGTGHVEWHEGRLSVNADAVPYRDLLTAIADTTGVEVWGLGTLAGSATVHFSHLTLRDGLRALLTHVNYAMLEEPSARGGEGRIVVLVIGQESGADSEMSGRLGQAAKPQTAVSVTADGPDTYQLVERMAERGDLRTLSTAADLGDPTTQALALQRLARQDPSEACRIAADAARSPDTTRRVLAVQVLGGLSSPEATATLGAALQDTDEAVRHAAVVGLMGHASPATDPFLVQALRDPAASIRLLAMELLARRGVTGVAAGVQ